MSKFNVVDTFTVAFVRSPVDAEQLVAAMPECFHAHGAFVIDAHPDARGLHQVRWSCHDLRLGMTTLELPFDVLGLPDLLARGSSRNEV